MILVLVGFLAAAPAQPTSQMKMASPGLKCVNIDAQACEFFSDYFAQQLAAASGVRITTQSEISSVLGFERQKQLLGCSDSATSCLAEMAGALGVDALVIGNLAKFGDQYVPNIKVVSARDGQAIATQTARVSGDTAILDWMGTAAKAMAGQLGLSPGKAGPPAAAKPTPPRRQAAAPPPPRTPPGRAAPPPSRGSGPRVGFSPWIPAGIAAGSLVASGITLAMAAQRHSELERLKSVPRARFEDLVNGGETLQTFSRILFAVGLTAGVASGYLFATQPRSPSVSAFVSADGAAVVVGGAL